MAFKTETYKIRGMQQDSSESAHSDEFAYENLNVRILTNGNNTSLSISQDIGNLIESNIYQVNNFGSPTPTIDVLTDIIVNSNYTQYMAAQPISYIPYKVIGYCTIDKYVVLFGIDSLGYSHISRLEYQNGIWYLFEFFDNTVLGFDVDHPIETLANVETEQIKKVYFVDGVNELRAINVVNPNSYNNISNLVLGFHIGFDETMTVEKNYAIPGRFPSCKIQFAFRYFNQNESESNFVEWSPMFDCDEGDQGFNNELPSQSTETSTNSFKISFTNLLYGDYSNIAIYYFIYPKLSSTSPICYKVNRNINSASYTTNIEFDEGDAIDATYEEVLSSGNTSIIPYTLASKDNFLICGNIKYGLPKLIDIDTKGLFDIVFEHHKIGHEEIDSAFVYQYNPYKTTFNGSNFDYMGYRRGNWYKFGIVCQYITGEWSEVIPLKIKQCNISSKSEVIYDEDNSVKQINYYIPQARLIADSSGTSTIDDRIAFFQTLYNLGFRKILPVCVCPPSDNYRDVLTQGIVTPTMYLPSQRVDCVNDNTRMFAIPSYFFRPQPLKNPIKKIEYTGGTPVPIDPTSSINVNNKRRFNDLWYYKDHLNGESDVLSLVNITPLYPYTIRNVEDIRTNIANVDSVNYNFTDSNKKDVITINNNYREFRNGYSLPPKDRINAECEISNISLNDFCYSLDNDSILSFFGHSTRDTFYSQFSHSFNFNCYYDYSYIPTSIGIGSLWSDRHSFVDANQPTSGLLDTKYDQTIFIDESLCTLNSPEIDYLQSMPSISTVSHYLNSARIEVCGYAQITAGGVNLSTNSDNKSNITMNIDEKQVMAQPDNLIGINIFDIQQSENELIYKYLTRNIKNIRGAKQQVIPFHSGPFWMDSNLTLALFGAKMNDEQNTTFSRYMAHPDRNGGEAFGINNNNIFSGSRNISSAVNDMHTQLFFKIDAKGKYNHYRLVPSWTGELITANSGITSKYRKNGKLNYTGSSMLYYNGVMTGEAWTTLLYTLDYVYPANSFHWVHILNFFLSGTIAYTTELTTGALALWLLFLDEYGINGYSADMTDWLDTNNGTAITYEKAFYRSWLTACLGLTPSSILNGSPWKLNSNNNSEPIINMSSYGFLTTNYWAHGDPDNALPSNYYTSFSSDIAGSADELNGYINNNYSIFYYFWPYTKNMAVTNMANANNSNYYWYQDDDDINPATDNMRMMVTYPRNPWNVYWNPYYYDSSLMPGVSGTEYVNGIPGLNPGDPPIVAPHPDLAIDPCEYGCHLYSPASMVFPNTLFEPMYLYGIYPMVSHEDGKSLVFDIQCGGDNASITPNNFKLHETHTLLYSNVTNYFTPLSENDIIYTNQEFYSNEQGRYPYIDYGIRTASALRVLYNFGQVDSATTSRLNLPTVSLIAATKWYKGFLGYDNNQIESNSLSCIGNFLTGYTFVGDVAFSGLLPRLYLKSGRIRNMYLDKNNKQDSDIPIAKSTNNSDYFYVEKNMILTPGDNDALIYLKGLLAEEDHRYVDFDHNPTDHIVFTSQYKEGNNRKILPPRFYIDSLIDDREPYTYKNINYQYAYMFPEYYYKAIVDGILPEHPEDVPCRYDAAKMYHAFLYPHSVTWCPYPTQALRGNKQNNYDGMPYWEYAQKDDIEHHGWAARSLNSQMSSYSPSYIMKYDEHGNARDENNYWFLQIANVYNQSLRDLYNGPGVVNNNPYEYNSGVSVAIWDWKACGYSAKISDILNILGDGKETYNVNYCEGDTFFVRYNCPKGYSKRASNSDAENLAENDITDTASLMIESYINLDGQVHKLDNIKNCSESSNILYPARQEHQLWINDCYSRWDSRIFHENDYNNPQSELDEYPTLIKWSLQKITGESIDSWGVFPASSAYYAHGECGDVNKLLQFNNNVYCFQERGVSILNFNPKSILSTDAGAPVTLAALEEASRLQDLVYVSKDYGTFNKWSVIKTLSSVYFIDNTVKALCRIGSNGIEVLSTSKYMRDYFQNNVDR